MQKSTVKISEFMNLYLYLNSILKPRNALESILRSSIFPATYVSIKSLVLSHLPLTYRNFPFSYCASSLHMISIFIYCWKVNSKSKKIVMISTQIALILTQSTGKFHLLFEKNLQIPFANDRTLNTPTNY